MEGNLYGSLRGQEEARSAEAEELPNEAHSAQPPDLGEVKKRLKDIFIYYASFGDRLNTTNLKSQKFHRLMQDAAIMSLSG